MSSKIPPELLKKIKESNNLVAIVGEHVVLRKSGANFTGLCPFHNERSPSFSVSEQKQLYHCYGCKKGGDVLTFMMEIHGLNFSEALEELAERGQVQLGEWKKTLSTQDPKVAARQKEQSLFYKLNRFAAAYFRQNLSIGGTDARPYQDYLSARGITPALEAEYHLGTTFAGWEGLTQRLLNGKAPLESAEKLGLIRKSQKPGMNSSGYFDLFRSRVMFPIFDVRGRVSGFGGRLIEAGEPKYLNSPESVVFQKSQQLFGLFQAQKHIRDAGEVIVVEGYFDVLGLVAAGIKNVVATCGTALTPAHLKRLLRFSDRILVLFDGDRAGIQATERAMEAGLEQGIVIYGAALPGGQDPDEVASTPEGVSLLQDLLKKAQPVLDTRIQEVVANARTAEGGQAEARSQALKQIASWLNKFSDPVGREIRTEGVCRDLQVSRELLTKALGPASAATAQRPNPARATPQKRPTQSGTKASRTQSTVIPPNERILLQSLTRLEARAGQFLVSWQSALERMPPKMTLSDLFEHPAAKSFTALRLEWALQNGSEWRTAFQIHSDFDWSDTPTEVRSMIIEALVVKDLDFTAEALVFSLDRAVERVWARFSHLVRAELADAELRQDTESQVRLMKEYLDVQRKMKEFSNFYE